MTRIFEHPWGLFSSRIKCTRKPGTHRSKPGHTPERQQTARQTSQHGETIPAAINPPTTTNITIARSQAARQSAKLNPDQDPVSTPQKRTFPAPLHFNAPSTLYQPTTEISQKAQILINNIVIKNNPLFTFTLIFFFSTVNLNIKTLKAHWEISKKMVFRKVLYMPIFSLIGYIMMELFRKTGNWRQISKHTSSTFCTSNDVSV